MEPLVLLKTYGDRGDPFAAYAELYRRPYPHPGDRGAVPGR
jgi:hypothetical protein